MRVKNDESKVVLDRVSLKLETNTKKWFSEKASTYGMPMAVYMQYILTQFYENQINAQAVRDLSAINKDNELKDTNKMLAELLTSFKDITEENSNDE